MAFRKLKKSNSHASKKPSRKLNFRVLYRVFKVYRYLYRVHWKPLSAGYGGLLLKTLVALLLPWPLKLILDYVILKAPLPPEAAFLTPWLGTDVMTLLAALVGAYVVLYLLSSVVSYVHQIGFLTAGARMTADIRYHVFAHLQRLSLTFHQSARSGDMIYRLTQDLKQVKTVMVGLPDALVYRVVLVVSHVGLMAILEWRLALVAISLVPIIIFYNLRFGKGMEEATETKRRKESEVSSIVFENVTAMALVQAYGREDSQQARFSSENRKSMESGIEAMRLSKLFKRLNDILLAMATGGVALYGGFLALDGVILPGTLVLMLTYVRKVYKPIKSFTDLVVMQAITAQVSCRRILDIVDCEMVMEDDSNAVPLPPIKGRIRLNDITFGYTKDLPVLKSLNFTVEPGENIALVGRSGAGKSTMISLLMRFYDPQRGQILIDNHDIHKVTLKSLREQITILMQDARLFNKTVAENIGFGKIGASRAEIIEAAKIAQAHDFISDMPDGYETIISEGGDNLSGGQKQRINIARAVIRNTQILILDEPATALDNKSEALLNRALGELTRDKTTFVIAHKFSTIANADKILMLEEGRLVAYGAHEELLATTAEYRKLYELQVGRQLEFAEAMSSEADNA